MIMKDSIITEKSEKTPDKAKENTKKTSNSKTESNRVLHLELPRVLADIPVSTFLLVLAWFLCYR
jgi:hypothetical protein